MSNTSEVSIWNLYTHLFFGKILRFLTCWKCIPGILIGGLLPAVVIWAIAPYSGKFSATTVLLALCLYVLELIFCALFSLVEVSAKMIVGWLFIDESPLPNGQQQK